MKGDANRAHSSVVPGKASPLDASGQFLDEAVWRYLFNQPVDVVGDPVPPDESCLKDLPHEAKKKKTSK